MSQKPPGSEHWPCAFAKQDTIDLEIVCLQTRQVLQCVRVIFIYGSCTLATPVSAFRLTSSSATLRLKSVQAVLALAQHRVVGDRYFQCNHGSCLPWLWVTASDSIMRWVAGEDDSYLPPLIEALVPRCVTVSSRFKKLHSAVSEGLSAITN